MFQPLTVIIIIRLQTVLDFANFSNFGGKKVPETSRCPRVDHTVLRRESQGWILLV